MIDPRDSLGRLGEQRPERPVSGGSPRLEVVHLVEHLLHHQLEALDRWRFLLRRQSFTHQI